MTACNQAFSKCAVATTKIQDLMLRIDLPQGPQNPRLQACALLGKLHREGLIEFVIERPQAFEDLRIHIRIIR